MQPFVGKACLILKPLIERLNLFLRVRWKQVIDGDVGRRYQDRLGMCERVVPILAVVIPDAGGSDPSVRHGLNEQENIGLIYGAAAERKGLQHPIDRRLISAENVAGKRCGERLYFCEQLSKVGVNVACAIRFIVILLPALPVLAANTAADPG